MGSPSICSAYVCSGAAVIHLTYSIDSLHMCLDRDAGQEQPSCKMYGTCFGRDSSSISSSSLMPFRRSRSLACLCCELFLAASTSALQALRIYYQQVQTTARRTTVLFP